jgi:hypothetical protein
LEFVRAEWAELKKAPFSFVGLAVVFLCLGFAGGMLYYKSQVESFHAQIEGRDGQISRYRVALGIDKASSGSLVELSNEELQAKAINSVSKLRDLSKALDRRVADINSLVKANKITGKNGISQTQAAWVETTDEYHRSGLRSDVLNVNNELLKRIDPKVAATVIRVPSVMDAETGASISVAGMIPPQMGMEALWLSTLADQVEQLARLLPVTKLPQ